MTSRNRGPLEETLAAFDATATPCTPLTASEVAAHLDCTRRTTYDRLSRLADRGDLQTKKIGARGRVWWREPSDTASVSSMSSPAQRQSLADAIVDAASVGVFVLTPDFEVAWANETIGRYFGLDVDDIVGRDKRTLIDESIADAVADSQAFAETMKSTYDDNTYAEAFECQILAGDGREERWVEHWSEPIDTGRYAGGRIELYYDVTDRKQANTALSERDRQFETMIDAVEDNAIFVVDGDGEVVRANERAEAVLGGSLSEKTFRNVPFRDADGTRLGFEAEPVGRTLETGEPVSGQVVQIPNGRDGEREWFSVTTAPITGDGGEVEQVVVSAKDVTRLKRQAHQLERQRDDLEQELSEIFERIDDAFYAVDDEFRFTYVNEQAERLLQQPATELLGESVWDMFPDVTETEVWDAFHTALEAQEPTSFEIDYDALDLYVEANVYPSESGLSVYFRDVTERKERELELARQRSELQGRERAMRRAYEVIADPDRSFAEQIDDLLAVVRETVGTNYATLSRVKDDEYVFEAVDAPAEADLQAGETIPLRTTNCERTVSTERTLVLDDVEADAPELADRAGNAEWGISCYLGAPVIVDGDVYGTFCFYDMEARTEGFSDWEVAFVELLSNWVGNEFERQEYTDRLVTLNELNDVVRGITDAVIDQSTREEIERTACEQLAAADSYEFAWIAEIDSATGEIQARTEAGVDGFLEHAELSVNADERAGQGPIGMAFRTRETQVSRDVFADPAFEPRRDDAERYGYRSSAAIPISHEDALYGVIGLYSDRTGAFAEEERRLVDQLGEIIGHAIGAAERKRALMSDELVEVEFGVEDVFSAVGASVEPAGTITLDQSISVADDEYLVYGTATADATDALTGLVGALPHWDSVTVQSDDDQARFELRLTEPPILSTVASLGGEVDSAVINDGTLQITVHLSPSVDVRQLTDAVQETYPTAKMLRRRQITRPRDGPERLRRLLATELTDRQHDALQSAYYSGFFEWPRESTGEDVASSLGVSSPTFHQHLRKAEQKIFDSLLDGSVDSLDQSPSSAN